MCTKELIKLCFVTQAEFQKYDSDRLLIWKYLDNVAVTKPVVVPSSPHH